MDSSGSREELLGSDRQCSRNDADWNSEKPSILTKNNEKKTWRVIWSSLSSFGLSTKQESTGPPKFSVENEDEKLELVIIKRLGDDCINDSSRKNDAKEKQKKNKNAAKPPRPPKGPSLDAADLIFMKEITEIAMKKRERIERLRALKKSKGDKHSSFNSSTTALFITFLFLIVIIFQGLSSRSNASPGSEHGSKNFISFQYFNNFSPSESNAPYPASTNQADFGLFSRGRSTHLKNA